uniref:ZM domain-containing protein n=1 Tax=Syphacia muris TaxID=451379 RepID=A0A0N5AF85_9BILA
MFFYSPNLPLPVRRATLAPQSQQLRGSTDEQQQQQQQQQQFSARNSVYYPYPNQLAPNFPGIITDDLNERDSNARHGLSLHFEQNESSVSHIFPLPDNRGSLKSATKQLYKRPTVTIHEHDRTVLV